MRFFSESGILLTAAVLVTSIAWANQPTTSTTVEATAKSALPVDSKTYTATGTTDLKTAQMLVNLLRNPHLKVKANAKLPITSKSPTYTAHGKVDRKTAMMLVNLLKNPYLQVRAEVHKVASRPVSQKISGVNGLGFSISGKTDMKTIKKLQALLKNNKDIQINLAAKNGAKKSAVNLNGSAVPVQKYRYQDYSTMITQGASFYHLGRPPVFIRGNTLWYPVPVKAPSVSK